MDLLLRLGVGDLAHAGAVVAGLEVDLGDAIGVQQSCAQRHVCGISFGLEWP